jgi:DNA-binding NarL/FixJ family response regulator
LIAVAVRLYRDGLAEALCAHRRFRVEATAGDAADVVAASHRVQPDVVIVDVALVEALTVIRGLRAQSSGRRILAFAVGDHVDALIQYAKAGADGFFSSSGTLAELVEAIERTAIGELMCSPRIAAELLRQAARESRPTFQSAAESNLTRREEQVFRFLQDGLSNKKIALALHISEATVKNHIHHLLQKMHVSTRGQAVAQMANRASSAHYLSETAKSLGNTTSPLFAPPGEMENPASGDRC